MLICVAEMGNRLSQSMKDQFQNMVKTGVTVPSLSHYVQYRWPLFHVVPSPDSI